MKPKVPILYVCVCVRVRVRARVCVCVYMHGQQDCIQNDKISSLPITLVDLSEKEKIPWGKLGLKIITNN